MKGTSCSLWKEENQRKSIEPEDQYIYLTNNPLTPVSVLLCLKLRDPKLSLQVFYKTKKEKESAAHWRGQIKIHVNKKTTE